MREDWDEVAARLVSILSDDDGVASSSYRRPAVTFSRRQSTARLPPQLLATERQMCETRVEFRHRTRCQLPDVSCTLQRLCVRDG